MLLRLAYFLYLGVAFTLVSKVILRTINGTYPASFRNHPLKFLITGGLIAFLWPISLLSAKGRRTLRNATR